MKKTYQKPRLAQMEIFVGNILCSSSNSNFSDNGEENTNITVGDEVYGGIFKSNEENFKNSIWE